MMRPSKRYCFRVLRNVMKGRSYQVVLDAASADFRNIHLFPAAKYVGLDLNKELLAKGIKNNPGAFGVQVDIRQAGAVISAGSIDLCVSMHTLSHIELADQVSAIQELIALNRPGGDLVFNVSRSHAAHISGAAKLRHLYCSVRIIHYRNALSRRFERQGESDHGAFQPNGLIKAIADTPLFVIVEMVTSSLGFGNESLVICSGKITGPSSEFAFKNGTFEQDVLFVADSGQRIKVLRDSPS